MSYFVRKSSQETIEGYPNLRIPKLVTIFPRIYPNIADILKQQYNLKDDDKIWVQESHQGYSPRIRNYRTKWKPFFSGTVSEFNDFINRKYEQAGKCMRERKTPEQMMRRYLRKSKKELWEQFYEEQYKHEYAEIRKHSADAEDTRERLNLMFKEKKKEIREIIEYRKDILTKFIQEEGRFPKKAEFKKIKEAAEW